MSHDSLQLTDEQLKVLIHFHPYSGCEPYRPGKTDQKSIEMLLSILKKELFKDYETETFLIPFQDGRYLDLLNKEANIKKTDYQADGTLITAEVAPKLKQQLAKYIVEED